MKKPTRTKVAAPSIAVCAGGLIGSFVYEHWARPQVTASLGANNEFAALLLKGDALLAKGDRQ